MNPINAYILDMDGTLYLDDQLIEGAKEFVAYLKTNTIPFVLLTNNSSKHAQAYVDKFRTMGLSLEVSDILTSGDATIDTLKRMHPDIKRLCLLGNHYLRQSFEDAGFVLIDEGTDVDAVVVGFDTDLTYQKLWHACDCLHAGKPYFATHPDKVCPLKDGASMPDVGAFMALLETATGRKPTIIGKPYGPMLEFVRTRLNAPLNTIAVVGDRLYTDMQMAHEYGMQSILVLSGETKEEDLRESHLTPTLVIPSIKSLLP